jgi:hypothetical protein
LRKKTQDLLEVLLVTLFQSVKKAKEGGRDRKAIVEDIFSKAKDEPRDMIGLQLIIEERVKTSDLLTLMKDKKKQQVLELADIASDLLKKLALRIGR